MRIDARPYANMALRYIISPQLQTEAVLWRRVRSPAGRGAEPCGLARQNTPAEDPRGKNPDRGKGRAGCGRKEAMLTRCRRGAYRSAFCCNSAARPQRQRVRITASAANQRQEQLRLRVLAICGAAASTTRAGGRIAAEPVRVSGRAALRLDRPGSAGPTLASGAAPVTWRRRRPLLRVGQVARARCQHGEGRRKLRDAMSRSRRAGFAAHSSCGSAHT
jgi:hypothetical protein